MNPLVLGTNPVRQRGAVAIMTAVLLFVLIGTAAFALDIGRWLVVRNEMQNASDAAALAGAGYLFPPVANQPNWVEAKRQGELAIPLNESERAKLTGGQVDVGYWHFKDRVFDPNTAKVKTDDDLPAVRVKLARKDGENMGPVTMFFGRLFGVDSIDAGAFATAVVSVPANAGAGVLAPIAVSSCLMTSADPPLWDSVNNVPIGSPPPKFVIASGAANGNHCNGCACGQWTTFENELNNVPPIRALIENGNGTPQDVGDNIWIQPGVEATVYDTADLHLTGRDILVPIVDDGSLESKGFTPIRGYACVHVWDVIKTSGTCETYGGVSVIGGIDDKGKPIDKTCMVVSFTSNPCKIGNSEGGGGGPFMGVYVPPRLVQ